jgi:cytochrome c5
MAHKQKKDPFAPVFLLIGIVLLGGAVFTLVSNLLTTIDRNSIKGSEDNSRLIAVANESLKPVGSVTTTAEVPKGGAVSKRSGGTADGMAIYKSTCFACHGTGVASAPILGNKDQWKARVANGLSALMQTALNGKGAMPAKGGNPALSDDEVKAAVLYMTKEAGFDLGGGEEAAKKAEPVPAPAKNTPSVDATENAESAAKEPAKEATVVDSNAESVAKELVKEAPAAAIKAVAAIQVEAPAKEAIEVKVEPAAPVKPEPVVEPKQPQTPTTPDVPSAPEAPAVKEQAPTEVRVNPEVVIPAVEKKIEAAPKALVTPVKEEAKLPTAPPTTAVAPTAVQAAQNAKGEAIYNQACFVCHKTGVAGAPLLGNKELWAPRIAMGMDALFHSALNGKGGMPAKGGNTTLLDDDVKAAVAYMVGQVK